MPTGPFPSELQVVGIGKESPWGTAAVADYYLSAKSPNADDVIDYIKDQGMRGTMADTHAVYPGPGYGSFKTGDFPVLVDSLGRLIGAMVGPDTVTGAVDYTHTFQLGVDQPASLTVTHQDGYEVRQYAGARPTELSFKWSEGAELVGSLTAESLLSAVGGTVTPAYGGSNLVVEGWMATATLNGTANDNLVGFQLDLKRKLYKQWAAKGQQSPSTIIAKALAVTGKATFDLVGDTELNDYLQNTQPSLAITLTNGTYSVQFRMSKCAFMKAPMSGKDVVQLDVDFEAVENATDSGNIEVVVVNGVATAY